MTAIDSISGALCGSEAQSTDRLAGQLIQKLAPLAGGKGGGKPDMARGAAPDRGKLAELQAAAHTLLNGNA
jgi:alanyl-tRNA synthetase